MAKKIRVLLIVSLFLIAFSGAASAYEAKAKRVDVDVDGELTSLNTTKDTVAQVLESMGIELEKDDIVEPALDAEVKDNLKISVYKTFMVTVNVDGVPKRLRVSKGTVKSAKEKIEQSMKLTTKLIGMSETDELKQGMTIELATSYTEKYEEQAEIPFEVLYVENAEVEEGTETVITEGAKGIKVTVFEKLYEGEKLVSTTPVETKTTLEPVNKVIEKGTKLKFDPVPVTQGTPAKVPEQPLKYSKVMTMNATAYTSDRGDAGTHTATGERARVGLVAVDPKVIPLGTILYVENYGLCRAADTGGAIKGNKIDLFFNTYEEMLNFGRRDVVVYVIEDADGLVAMEETLDLTGGDTADLFAS